MNIFENIYNQIITEATLNKWDKTGQNYERGNEAEQYFQKVAQYNNYAFQFGTASQDFKDHIDGTLFSPNSNKRYTVEIKAKKNERDCGVDNILVELRSRGGVNLPGWLYGKADFLAFMYENKQTTYPYHQDIFILINRESLKQITEKLTDTKWTVDATGKKVFNFNTANLVNNTCEAIAPKLYSRGVNDPYSLITRIPLTTVLEQLEKNKTYFILKYIEKKVQNELKAKNEDIKKYIPQQLL